MNKPCNIIKLDDFMPGDDLIRDGFDRAKTLAIKHNCAIRICWNGCDIDVFPDSTAREIDYAYTLCQKTKQGSNSSQVQELIEAAEKICAKYPLDYAANELQLALQNVKKSDK